MRRRILSGAGILLAAVVLIGGAFLWIEDANAKPDLRGFQPVEMGRLEAAMWRSYYEGRWVRLGWQTLEVAHGQYRFSLWDSLRMAASAARSALYFRKKTDDPRCLPELEVYYTIIRQGLTANFDVSEAARLELAWWKERRQHIAPQDYARTIAKLTALVYAVPAEAVLPASALRAGAMAYRDARRDGRMTVADWQEVARQLEKAYAALQQAVSTPS